jgi:hypothetical protein
MSGVSKPYSELYSPVCNDASKFHLRRPFAVKVDTVQSLLKTRSISFFSDGIKKLVKCWNRCVEVEGDYVV